MNLSIAINMVVGVQGSMTSRMPHETHTPWEKTSKPELGTNSLHCSSCFGLPSGILNINLIKTKLGTTMETVGKP